MLNDRRCIFSPGVEVQTGDCLLDCLIHLLKTATEPFFNFGNTIVKQIVIVFLDNAVG